MSEDERRDPGQYYPGGDVVPVRPIKADGNYVTMGADQYIKSEIVDGVQHYKKVVLAYDADMEDWGFNLTGDYILSGSSFVEA